MQISEASILFCIGAMKAGTTWFGKHLERHSEFCVSPIKEVHYFDSRYREDLCGGFDKLILKRLKWVINEKIQKGSEGRWIIYARALLRRLDMLTDEGAYLEHFSDVYKNEKYIADLTPTYALLRRSGFEKMRHMFPESRFLFIMRNPVDRYWSHLRFASKSMPDVSPVDDAEGLLRDARFWERTDYGNTLSELYSVIPVTDIFVCFYENVFGDSERGREKIRRFEKFCNVAHLEPQLEKVVAKSQAIALPPNLRKRLVKQLSKVYLDVEGAVEGPLPDSWKDDMQNNL